MTMLTPGMLKDRQTANREPSKPVGALQRLRNGLTDSRPPVQRMTTTGQQTGRLLRDVALGGTAASAANAFLKQLASGRRA